MGKKRMKRYLAFAELLPRVSEAQVNMPALLRPEVYKYIAMLQQGNLDALVLWLWTTGHLAVAL